VLKNHYQIFLVNLPSFAKLSFKKDKYKYRGSPTRRSPKYPSTCIQHEPGNTKYFDGVHRGISAGFLLMRGFTMIEGNAGS